ncbi:rab11 family-interacting protein 4A-like [Stigmatopora nigra]
MDLGSTPIFFTEALWKKLNIKGKPKEILLSTMNHDRPGGLKPMNSYMILVLEVCLLEESKFIVLSKVYTHCNIPVHSKNIPKQSEIRKWPDLSEVRLPEIEADVGILIGDNCASAMEPWHIINSCNEDCQMEEKFEDYGEGKDADFSPSSPNHDKNSKVKCYSNLEYSFPSSGGHANRKLPQLYSSELLDINCSQCCKKVNLLNDLDARLRNIKASSPNRNISSTAFGHQLFQANHNVFDSSQESSTAEIFTESIDSCELNITKKVSYLEKKVTELENDSLVNADLKSKLKLENTQLVHRVHELEEQMKDIETRGDQNLEEESKRHSDVYSKMERDRNREIDFLFNRIQQLEDENGEMKTNVYRLKSQAEKLDQDYGLC